MATQTRSTLKSYFNTGDVPLENQFADLIDSTTNIIDDNATKWTVYRIYNDTYVPAKNWTPYGSGNTGWSYTITHNLGTTSFIPSFALGFFDTDVQRWDVMNFNEIKNYIQTTFGYGFQVTVTNNDILFFASGLPTKPEITFGLRLMKV